MGFEGRRLGQEQMTTDTAARVTRIVVADRREHYNTMRWRAQDLAY